MKHPTMEAALEQIAQATFGNSRAECLASAKCVSCNGDAKEFKDELSRKKYRISGMCQKCQNAIWA